MIVNDLKNMELPDDALDNVNGGITLKDCPINFSCTNENQAKSVISAVQVLAPDIYNSIYHQLKAAKTKEEFGFIIGNISLIDSISPDEIAVLYDCFNKYY